MVFAWTPYAVPALVAGAMAFSMAAFIASARPDRTQNRTAALMLTFEGLTLLLLAGGAWLVDDARAVLLLHWIGAAAVVTKCFVYLLFLSTLDTRLARPLRSRAARILLVEGMIGGFIIGLISRREWFVAAVPGDPVAEWMAVPGRAFLPLMAQGVGILFLLGLVFSIAAWREARTPEARRRARMFMLAFGTRDVLFAIWAFTLPFVPPGTPAWILFFISVSLIWILYIPLVAYGILKTQLFDIDIKLKFAVKGTTVAAAFVAAFFIVSEAATVFLSERIGTYAGVVAAGLLVFAIAPLQRIGDRVANVAMPSVTSTPEYLAFKKLEVYRAALEGALEDGTVSERERAMLRRLCDKLGIAHADAAAMERDVLGGAAPA